MTSTKSTPSLPQSFIKKKAKILQDLAKPAELYDDLSPKGSIDVSIRDLIDGINDCDGLVTLSSCGGRISVFREGIKKDSVEGSSISGGNEEEEKEQPSRLAAAGGKGGGGTWLFVSHDPIDLEALDTETSAAEYLGIHSYTNQDTSLSTPALWEENRLVHFKFEPMILHIQTASPYYAHTVLTAAVGAGFRESGASGLHGLYSGAPETTSGPMVAVRTMGLSLESVIGYYDTNHDQNRLVVSEEVLVGLLKVGNQRFIENSKRIERFRTLLQEGVSRLYGDTTPKVNADGEEWEDAAVRKERKRAEGLKRAEELKKAGKEGRGQVTLEDCLEDDTTAKT